jgi:hypothetical protein
MHGDKDTLNEFPTFRSKLVRLGQLRNKDIQTMPQLVTAQVVQYLVHMPMERKMQGGSLIKVVGTKLCYRSNREWQPSRSD